MQEIALTNIFWTLLWLGFGWLLYRVVIYTRKRHFDPCLWGTLLEAFSHYVQPQDQIKEPKQVTSKIKKIPHEDKADNQAKNLEQCTPTKPC